MEWSGLTESPPLDESTKKPYMPYTHILKRITTGTTNRTNHSFSPSLFSPLFLRSFSLAGLPELPGVAGGYSDLPPNKVEDGDVAQFPSPLSEESMPPFDPREAGIDSGGGSRVSGGGVTPPEAARGIEAGHSEEQQGAAIPKTMKKSNRDDEKQPSDTPDLKKQPKTPTNREEMDKREKEQAAWREEKRRAKAQDTTLPPGLWQRIKTRLRGG